MAVTALIKFTQGLTVGLPGVALAGASGAQVDVENDNPTDIASWKIDLVYTPPGSGVSTGTLATGNSNTPFASFTPGAQAGAYRVVLTVYSGINQTGVSDKDIRCFVVLDANGIVFPPYQELPTKLPVVGSGLPGEKPDELNLNQQPYGWDGSGSDGLLLDFMRQTSSLLGGGGGGGNSLFDDLAIVRAGTVAFTATAGNLYILAPVGSFVDSSRAVTLPAAPNDGDVVGLTIFPEDGAGAQNGYVAVLGGANTIQVDRVRVSTTVTLWLDHGVVYLRWNAAGSVWEAFGNERLESPYSLELSDTFFGLSSYTLTWPNFTYQYNGALAGTISLPPNPKQGDVVQLREFSNVAAGSIATITIDGNGNTIRVPFVTAPIASFDISSKGATLTFRYHFTWWLTSGHQDVLLSQSADTLLASSATSKVVPVSLLDNSLLGKQVSDVGAIAVAQNTVVGRGTGNVGAIATIANGLLGRSEGVPLMALEESAVWHILHQDATNDIPDATTGDIASYSPLDWNKAHSLRWSGASPITIRGIVTFPSGFDFPLLRRFANRGTANMTLTHEDVGAAASERIVCPNGTSLVLAPNESVFLQYSVADSRWFIIAQDVTGGGGGGISPTLFDANTILKADVDDTPLALSVGQHSLVGRQTGNITAFTATAGQLIGRGRQVGATVESQTPAIALNCLFGEINTEFQDNTTGTQTLYNPDSNFDAQVHIRWQAASDLVIQGAQVTESVNSSFKRLTNLIGSTANIVIQHEAVAASAVNRFLTPGGVDYTILPGESAILMYSPAQDRYIVVGKNTLSASLFDANTVLKADVDDTPVALSLPINSILARQGGNIVAMSVGTRRIVGRTASGLTLDDLGGGDALNAIFGDQFYQITDNTTGTETSYNPSPEFEAAHTVLWQAATDLTIQGAFFTSSFSSHIKRLTNLFGSTGNIVIQHENVAALADRRFLCPGGTDFTIQPGESVFIHRNIAAERWVVVAASSGSGGISPTLFDANTILKADSDDTPVALTVATNSLVARQAGSIDSVGVGEGEIVGRAAGGNLDGLTRTQILGILFPSQTFVDAAVQTVDATATTIATYSTLADERVIKMHLEVVGREPTTDDTISYTIEATFNRDGSSVVTSIAETVVDNTKTAGAAAWTVQFTISTQDVLIQVVGEAAHTIEWRVVGKVFEHGA